jgi:hypothetical protein
MPGFIMKFTGLNINQCNLQPTYKLQPSYMTLSAPTNEYPSYVQPPQCQNCVHSPKDTANGV